MGLKEHAPWTPKDELILAQQEVKRLEQITDRGGDIPQDVLDALVEAYEIRAHWEAVCAK